MEVITFLTPLATVVIALVALFTGMGWIFNWLLEPVKENQRDLKTEQKEIHSELRVLKSRMDRIESKLDLLISKQA